jgi:hypothetical protein
MKEEIKEQENGVKSIDKAIKIKIKRTAWNQKKNIAESCGLGGKQTKQLWDQPTTTNRTMQNVVTQSNSWHSFWGIQTV